MNRYFDYNGLPGKFVISMGLLAIAFMLAGIYGGTDRWICFLAMGFSSLGDIVLMNFQDIEKKLPINKLYLGCTLFMISHLIYAYAFTYLIKLNDYAFINGGVVIMSFAILITTFVLVTIVRLQKCKAKRSLWMVLIIYLGIIAINCLTIASFAWSARGYRILAGIGVFSFYISDLVLGYEKLTKKETPITRSLVWWFYPIGQFLILVAC